MPEPIEIIIAEDHHLFRNTIIKDLKKFNIKTIAVALNGIELIEHLKTKTPDVVLLDLEMPKMDGNKALKIITNDFPRTKVIIISLFDDDCLMEHYMSRGVKGYLPKQFITSKLTVLAKGITEVKNNGTCFYSYDASNPLRFSKREVEIIPLLSIGKTSKEISIELGLSEKAIEAHRNKIFKKTNSNNIAEFVRNSIKRGLEFLGK